jgi:hypothetical protein
MPSTRRILIPLFTVFLLAVAAGGCGLAGPCEPETRDVTAATSGSTSAGSDYAEVMLSEYRAGPGSLYWSAQGPPLPLGEVASLPLEQHVLAARLLDGGSDMALLLELPVRPIEGLGAVGGQVRLLTEEISFEPLFDLVRSGRGVLELETDIPGRERLILPLQTVFFRDWSRRQCD